MKAAWFRPRTYRHFDIPVGESFIQKTENPLFVAQHSWSPLISYIKRTKRYKPLQGQTIFKERPIMYASHRDACILSRYAFHLTRMLDTYYKTFDLSDVVIAYRKLGKSNYHFTKAAYDFAQDHMPCVVMCFDISGFFDNIDHRILKEKLVHLLQCPELPRDWYVVFKNVTRFRHVEASALRVHPVFGPRMRGWAMRPVASIAEVSQAEIPIQSNPNSAAIPQGTPISAALSNLYMIDFDKLIKSACEEAGGFYQRYSDDILIILPSELEQKISELVSTGLSELKLAVNVDKTERVMLEPQSSTYFQYLGFNLSPSGAVIRPSSLARQWRKARRSIRRTGAIGSAAVASGKAKKIFTRKLRARFLPVGTRNFSSYARRSAETLGSKKIVRQVLRLEKTIERSIRSLDPPNSS